MADGVIRIDTKIDDSQVKKQLDGLAGTIKTGIGGAVKAASIALGALTAATGGMFVGAVKQASNLGESMNAASVVFTTASDDIIASSKNASTQVGLSAAEFDQAAAVIGAGLINAGASAEEAAVQTDQLISRAADMASIFNTDVNDAITAVAAGLRGESEPLRRYAVTLDQATVNARAMAMGLVDADGEVTKFGESQARLQIVMEQSNRFAGDFVNTSDGLANGLRVLQAIVKDSAAEIGTAFLPAIEDIVGGIREWVTEGDNLTKIQDGIKNLIGAFLDVAIPVVTVVGDIVKGFLEWAGEGDNLTNTIEMVGIALATAAGTAAVFWIAFNAGKTAATIMTGLTVAIKLMTAAMAANPIGVIAVIITAVLIPAIILLIKNWDYVVVMFQTTIAKIGGYFKLFGSVIEETFTVAFASAKIAIMELTQTISQKLFSAVGNFIELMSGLPFVGEKFEAVGKKVNGVRDALNENINAAKDEQNAVITASRNKQNQIEKEVKSSLVNIEKEKKARIAALDAQKKKNKDTSNDITKIVEDTPALGSANIEDTEKADEAAKKLTETLNKYGVEAEKIEQKVKDGAITEEEGRKQLLKLTNDQIDALYEMGYTADETGNEGDQALAKMIAKTKELKDDTEKPDWGKKIAEGFKKAGEAMKVAGELIKGTVETIGKVVDGVVNTFKNIFDVLGKMAEFDPEEMLDKFKGLLDGLTKFFTETLPNIPGLIEAGAEMLSNFLNGLTNNIPAIIAAVERIVDTIVSVITTNKDAWLAALNSFVFAISIVLLENIPMILEIFLGLFTSLIQTIRDNFPAILPVLKETIKSMISTFTTLIPEIIDIVSELATEIVSSLAKDGKEIVGSFLDIISNILKVIIKNTPSAITAFTDIVIAVIDAVLEFLPDFIQLSLELIVAVVKGLMDNQEKVIKAIFNIIEAIIDIIIDSIPWIIDTFMELIPMLISGIIESIPVVIVAIVELIMSIIGAIIDMIPEIIAAFISMIPILIASIIGSIPKVIVGIIQLIIGIIGAIIENLPKIVEAFIEVIPKIIQGLIDNKDKIADAFTNMAGEVMDAFVNGIIASGANMWNNVKATFENFGNEIKSSMDKAWEDAVAGQKKIQDYFSSGQAEGDWNDFWSGDYFSSGRAEGDWNDFWGGNAFANGTNNAPGGMALVGENGPELVNLPKGSQVFTANETKGMLNGSTDFNSLLNNMTINLSPKVLNSFNNAGERMINALLNGIMDAVNGMWDNIKPLFDTLTNNIKDSINNILDTTLDTTDAIKTEVVDVQEKSVNAFNNVADIVKNNFTKDITKNDIMEIKKDMTDLGEETKRLIANGEISKEDLAGRNIMQKLMNDKATLLSVAHNNVLNGLNNGFKDQLLNSQIKAIDNRMIVIHNQMTGNVAVDGREIGRIAFKNIDRNVRGAYGNQSNNR